MNMTAVDNCPLCGGEKRPGETTFSVELGHGIIVVRHVPATVCVQCGSDWISDDVAAKVEEYVEEARGKNREVEVVGFP